MKIFLGYYHFFRHCFFVCLFFPLRELLHYFKAHDQPHDYYQVRFFLLLIFQLFTFFCCCYHLSFSPLGPYRQTNQRKKKLSPESRKFIPENEVKKINFDYAGIQPPQKMLYQTFVFWIIFAQRKNLKKMKFSSFWFNGKWIL